LSYIRTSDELKHNLIKIFKNKPYKIKIHDLYAPGNFRIDTVHDVAKEYGTSIEAIEIANDLKKDSPLGFRRYLIVPIESSEENLTNQQGANKKN